MLLQVSAILYFWIGLNAFSASFVMNFVVCMVLLAADFWTVKNVTGRLLVGMRWWNDAAGADGNTTWRFESLDEVR